MWFISTQILFRLSCIFSRLNHFRRKNSRVHRKSLGNKSQINIHLGMKRQHIIFLHIFYWIFFIWYQFRYQFVPDNNGEQFFVYALGYSFLFVNVLTFYLNYFFILPRVYKKQKLYALACGLIGMFVFFALSRYLIEEVLYPVLFGFHNYHEKTTYTFYLYDNLFYSYTTIFISTLIWFLNNALTVEKEKRQLIEEKKNSELQALKTQINPHFIFNSLNNIYSLVYQKSDKALPAIEELSQLLRYSTKDLEKDYITIDKEITYIESLIGLEKLRIKNPELIIFEKNIHHPKTEISPMLLVPFVENAFKHGDFNGKGFILKIVDTDGVLHFYLQNWKTKKQKDTSSGIGIENVRKRLEILYPKKYELEIKDSDADYIVDLKIDLTP